MGENRKVGETEVQADGYSELGCGRVRALQSDQFPEAHGA